MSWTERLRPGRFRNAVFHVEVAEEAGGRRDALHEFPQRDESLVEDLGLGPQDFTLDVFVLGEDYMTARDALIAACSVGGPGELVHPYRGALTVWCRGYRVRESSDDGGLATFSIGFTRAPQATPADGSASPGAEAEAAAVAAQQAALDGLTRDFTTAGLPGHLAEASADRLTILADRLEPALARLGGLRDRAAAAALQVAELRGRALDLVRSVPDMGRAVSGLIVQVRLLASTPRTAFRELLALIGLNTGARTPGDTPVRLAEGRNADSLERLVTLAAAAEASRAVRQIDFASYEDAAGARTELAEALDAQAVRLADAGDDEGHAVLTALRLATVRALVARGATLARVFVHVPAATEPVLVIAQRLYGDATRAEEIVRRNDLRRPDFVMGGEPLEVLTDA
jgi:prophage DNA circulation protein